MLKSKIVTLVSVALASLAVGCSGRSGQNNDGGHDGGDGGDGGGTSLTIYDIQDPASGNHPAANSSVKVVDVVVTTPMDRMTDPTGFWVEEKPGGKYSGIFVYAPGLGVTVKAGDVAEISGTYQESYDQSEIVATSVTVTGSDAIPAPEVVTPSQVHTGGADSEAYEGVLVEVQTVTVSRAVVPGSDGQDHGDFGVTGAGSADELVVTDTFTDYYDYTRTAGDKFNRIT